MKLTLDFIFFKSSKFRVFKHLEICISQGKKKGEETN